MNNLLVDKQEIINAIERHSLVLSGREYDEFEERIFTTTMGKLFADMKTDAQVLESPLHEICTTLKFNEYNDPYLEFKPSELSKKGVQYVYDRFCKIFEKKIRITTKDDVIFTFPLFAGVMLDKPLIKAFFSNTTLRYLLYFGQGEGGGGSFYDFIFANTLGSALASRFYKFFKSIHARNLPDRERGFWLSVARIQRDFNTTYTPLQFEQKILKPLKSKMEASPRCLITFTWKFIKEDVRMNAGRKAIEVIHFKTMDKK